MPTLTLAENKSKLLAVVAAEKVVITRRGRPVARIIPEPDPARAGASSMVGDLRDFVLSQPLQARPAASVVRGSQDGERY